MLESFIWWLTIQILALAVLPVAWRLGRSLPDGGAVLAKPLGLLLPGYVLWLSVSFGLLDNSARITPFVVAGVLGLVAWLSPWSAAHAEQPGFWMQRWQSLLNWVRGHRGAILAIEVAFAAGFVLIALLRSHNPEIMGTEKPMEFAFLNAILRSQQFPPNDPWLSGFSISYYYFGYLITAMLVRLTGITSGVGFNLMLASLAGLSAAGIVGLLVNLVGANLRGWIAGALGSFLLLLAANLEGFIEVLNSNRLLSPAIWSWLNIRELPKPDEAFTAVGAWWPGDNWWWWRATRVLGEPLKGRDDYTISEFPFFSFLLGDLHPHVLALPFNLLVIALAFALYRLEDRLDLAWLRKHWFEALLVAIIAGGLGFMNTWDIALGIGALAVAFAFQTRRTAIERHASPGWGWLGRVAGFVLGLSIAALLLYSPFYLFFRSQAQGFGVSVWATNPVHLLIVWGIFLPGLFGLFWLAFRSKETETVEQQLPEQTTTGQFEEAAQPAVRLVPAFATAGVQPAIFAGSDSAGMSSAVRVDEAGESSPRANNIPLGMLLLAATVILPLLVWFGVVLGGQWIPGFAEQLGIADLPRLIVGRLPVLLVLGAMLVGGGAMLVGRLRSGARDSTSFALALAVLAIGLVWFCELFYLRDLFNSRMNTVFKFYFQAWMLLSIAAAYALVKIVRLSRAATMLVWVPFVVLAVLASLYTIGAWESKATLEPPSLDGTAWMENIYPGDAAAIRWLNTDITGAPTILEAVGNSYSEYARVSTFTGLPAVLGWPGHEDQWRGNSIEQNIRKPLVEEIYKAPDKAAILPLLARYHVQYIYVGSLERQTYGVEADGFDNLPASFEPVYRSDNVTIYRVRTTQMNNTTTSGGQR